MRVEKGRYCCQNMIGSVILFLIVILPLCFPTGNTKEARKGEKRREKQKDIHFLPQSHLKSTRTSPTKDFTTTHTEE